MDYIKERIRDRVRGVKKKIRPYYKPYHVPLDHVPFRWKQPKKTDSYAQQCNRVLNIQHEKSVCWFDLFLVMFFSSQHTRSLLKEKLKERSIIDYNPAKIFMAKGQRIPARYQLYKIVDDLLLSNNDASVILDSEDYSLENIELLINRIEPRKAEESTKNNLSYDRYPEILGRLLKILKIKCAFMVFETTKTYGDIGFIRPLILPLTRNQKIEDNKTNVKHITDIQNDLIRNKIDIVFLDNMVNTYPVPSERSALFDQLNNLYYEKQDLKQIQLNLSSREIQIFDHVYFSDSVFLTPMNPMNPMTKNDGNCKGEELVGITCNGKPYIYNGRVKKLTNEFISPSDKDKLGRRAFTCELQEYDWHDRKNKILYALPTDKCKLKVRVQREIENLVNELEKTEYEYFNQDLDENQRLNKYEKLNNLQNEIKEKTKKSKMIKTKNLFESLNYVFINSKYVENENENEEEKEKEEKQGIKNPISYISQPQPNLQNNKREQGQGQLQGPGQLQGQGQKQGQKQDIPYDAEDIEKYNRLTWRGNNKTRILTSSNWSAFKENLYYGTENKKFDPETFKKSMLIGSPKLTNLMYTIKEQDKRDLEKFGKTFKHVIYTGLSSQYGVKLICGAFVAYDYKLAFKSARKKYGENVLQMIKLKPDASHVGLLTKSVIFGKHMSEDLIRKILKIFNDPVENLYGDKMRFLIIDRNFKEGIDLNDVKYMHLFEPLTHNDERQVIGRATRLCGQKNLPFINENNLGWPLYVKIYDTWLPSRLRTKKIQTMNDLYLHNTRDFSNMMSSQAFEKACHEASVDFYLNDSIHNIFTKRTSNAPQNGGSIGRKTRSNPLKWEIIDEYTLIFLLFTMDVYISLFSWTVNPEKFRLETAISTIMSDVQSPYYKWVQKNEVHLRKDSTNDGLLKYSLKLTRIQSLVENNYDNIMRNIDMFYKSIDSKNSELRSIVSDMKVHVDTIVHDIQNDPSRPFNDRSNNVMSDIQFRSESMSGRNSTNDRSYKTDHSHSDSHSHSQKNVSKEFDLMDGSQSRSEVIKYRKQFVQPSAFFIDKPLDQFEDQNRYRQIQKFVFHNFKKFRWTDMQWRNMCTAEQNNLKVWDEDDDMFKEFFERDEKIRRRLQNRKMVQFNPTQNFVRHYFTPNCGQKSILLYHSVGTGKCHTLDTPILMYDSSIKMVQDIKVGDQLMSDTGSPRNVLSLARGKGKLYKVHQHGIESYGVNEDHIMCLKAQDGLTLREMKDFVRDDGIIEIEVKVFLHLRESLRTKLYGYKFEDMKNENENENENEKEKATITIEPIGHGDYFGFTLDGNNRYLLGDRTVTHNTCTAIATATTSFTPKGFSILWVTRRSLKSDLQKNLYTKVCHLTIQQLIMEGKIQLSDIRADTTNQKIKEIIKKTFLLTLSYKEFENAVTNVQQASNRNVLIARNGNADVLRNTLVIIDEAHNLYGMEDEAPANEKLNMKKIEAVVNNSYEVSKDRSVRFMFLTGTPFTKDPMELVKLLKLGNPSMNIPTSSTVFKSQFIDKSSGNFTIEGKKRFMNQIAGQISYLDRTHDRRQFAHPIIDKVFVNASKAVENKPLGISSQEEVLYESLKKFEWRKRT